MRLIDADVLQKRICNATCGYEYEDCDSEYDCDYDFFIFNAPTIDPESLRPQGEWVNWGKSGTPTYENYGTCCVCHEDAEIHTEHRNYCPNCGTKMKGCDKNA